MDDPLIINNEKLQLELQAALGKKVWALDRLMVNITLHLERQEEPLDNFYVEGRFADSGLECIADGPITTSHVVSSNITITPSLDLRNFLTVSAYRISRLSKWLNNELATLSFFCRIKRGFDFSQVPPLGSLEQLQYLRFSLDLIMREGNVTIGSISHGIHLSNLLSAEKITAIWNACSRPENQGDRERLLW